MTDSTSQNDVQVERIVREVMARLAKDRSHAIDPPRTDCPPRIELDQTLVTLNLLEDRLDGISELALKPRAVITPAARDFIKQKNVRVVPLRASKVDATKTPAGELAVGIADCNGSVVTIKQLQNALPQAINVLDGRDTVELVHAVRRHALQHGRGLIVTSKSATALCIANRIGAVRAVCATNVKQLQHALAEVGANVAIIDPTGRSTWQQLQLARCFASAWHVPCPQELMEAL